MPKQPTVKQRKAIQNAVENGGNISKAMRDAGYSPATAKNPDKLTNTKAWTELMEQYLPDEQLLAVHAEGLEATRASNAAILVTKDGNVQKAEEQGLIEVPDYGVRAKYLELALKLKRRIGPESQVNIAAQSTGEMQIEFS